MLAEREWEWESRPTAWRWKPKLREVPVIAAARWTEDGEVAADMEWLRTEPPGPGMRHHP